MTTSRIPKLFGSSKKAASAWLAALQKKDLLFCIDDDPRDMFSISDGSKSFTDKEAAELTTTLNRLFSIHGDKLYELAFNVISSVFHTEQERSEFKRMYG